MNFVNASLRRPVTVVVLVVGLSLVALVGLGSMSRDVFPPLGIPTIYVAQPYGGMDPAQMEGYLTYRYEYHFLYITGIEHVESKSIQGASIMKLQFHPGTDMSQAMSETVAQVNRSRAFMPPGTVPPFVMRFDAGSVAVGYLVFATDNPQRTLGEMQDQALNRVRPLFATLPGVSAPPPFGGSSRGIVVNVDPERMRAHGLAPDEIVQAVATANLISPSGNINLGDAYPIVRLNSIVTDVRDLEDVLLRGSDGANPGAAVYLRDVASVADGSDITTSYALANGLRTVYLPVTKRSDASTLDVVESVRRSLPEFQKILPEDITVSYEFDQTPVVHRSIDDLVREGGLGALLTGLMVLIFLRDWRSALVVVVNIPLALLAALLGLWIAGQDINLMTLGGLALAVGILVDEATVTVENIHAQLARGRPLARAALEGTRETALPRLLAMLCILAVFIPATLMEGAARALFVPMAMAVGFSMIASYLLSSTLVPVLAVWMLKESAHGEPSTRPASGLRRGYGRVVSWAIAARGPLVVVYLLGALGGLALVAPRLGLEIFPRVDSGQFALRMRAPAGTQVEIAEARVQRVLATIAREAGGPEQLAVTIGMVGVHGSSFPVNLVHLWNGGPEEAWLAVQLAPGSGLKVAEFTEQLRAVLGREEPDLRLSFEPQDLVARVMSFGSPTPLEIAVTGPDLGSSLTHAQLLRSQLESVPFLRDVQISQTMDYPTLDVHVDRERAGMLGVTEASVANSLLTATSSSRFTSANFWADPRSGITYNLQVQIPQQLTRSVEDLLNIPVVAKGGGTALLRNVAEIQPTTSVATYERYNMARVVSLTANIHGTDLGTAVEAVRGAIEAVRPQADGRIRVDVRGQVVALEQLLDGFQVGLAVAVAVIFLLLAGNFESARLALAVIATVPAVLLGVTLSLWLTGTTLNVQSAIGGIMAVGVAVANSILLVTFAERARLTGMTPREAAHAGVLGRLRPILMTSLAMLAGMLPLALGLGEGGEQTAPLGRAVMGGLTLATLATLFVLPAVFALVARRATHSGSLDPEDPQSPHWDLAPSAESTT